MDRCQPAMGCEQQVVVWEVSDQGSFNDDHNGDSRYLEDYQYTFSFQRVKE